MRRLVCIALVVAAAGAQAAPDSPDRRVGDAPLSDFYVVPAELPAEPGRLIRREPLPSEFALPGAGTSARILYSSTDGVGGRDRIAVSGVLYLPAGEPPSGGWPLLAWAHGTVGVADACAPSWAGRSARDVAYLGRWLGEGYAIVASDYQGLGVAGPHPYLLTRPAAYSNLDAIRAVLSATSELARDKVVVIGQSQGGGAAFATGAFAPAYAPDVKLRGVVATGVPYLTPRTASSASQPDIDKVDPTIAYLLYIAIAAQSAMASPPDPADLFAEPALPLLERARTTCVGPLFKAVADAGLTRRSAVRSRFVELLAPLYRDFAYPTLKIEVPVFIGTGGADNDVRPQNQLALVRDSCASGTLIEAHLYEGLDHGGAVNGSLRHSLPFVRKAMAGEPVERRCDPTPE